MKPTPGGISQGLKKPSRNVDLYTEFYVVQRNTVRGERSVLSHYITVEERKEVEI